MERKIGEIFICNGKLYQVVKGFSCNGCSFIKNGNCYLDDKLLGPCEYTRRTDKTSVIFKLISNMEIKNNQLIIDIPEGRATLSVILSLALPLLLFLPGYFLGRVFFTSEISMALMGFLFMALGFGVSAIIFTLKKRYFSPIVIDKEEE